MKFEKRVGKHVFLSTPSVRRATTVGSKPPGKIAISIHALREEGDRFDNCSFGNHIGFLSTPSVRRATQGAGNHP